MKKIILGIIILSMLVISVIGVDLSNMPIPILEQRSSDIRTPGIIDSLLGTFSITSLKQSYSTNDLVSINYEGTNWNLVCEKVYAVVERYNVDNPNTAEKHDSVYQGSVGSLLSGGAQKTFKYGITYGSGSVVAGSYENVGYLWCDDTTEKFRLNNKCLVYNTQLCKDYDNGAIVSNADVVAYTVASSVTPSSKEVCDGKDNDGDGVIDDGISFACTDQCGNDGTYTCANGFLTDCSVQEVCNPETSTGTTGTPCTSDVTYKCSDTETIITSKCSIGTLEPTGNTCATTPTPQPTAESSAIGLDSIALFGKTFQQGKPVPVNFVIYNSYKKTDILHSAGATTKAEAGIYSDTPEMRQLILGTTDLSGFSLYGRAGVKGIVSCGGETEDFVDSLEVLSSSEAERSTWYSPLTTGPMYPEDVRTYELQPKAPTPQSKLFDGTSNYNPQGKYFVVVNLFDECGASATKVASGANAGTQNTRVAQITITDKPVPQFYACIGCSLTPITESATCDASKYFCAEATTDCSQTDVCKGTCETTNDCGENTATSCSKPFDKLSFENKYGTVGLVEAYTDILKIIFTSETRYACSNSLTVDELNKESPTALKKALCVDDGNCNPREGYKVSCESAQSLGIAKDSFFFADKTSYCHARSESDIGASLIQWIIHAFNVTESTAKLILYGGGALLVLLIVMAGRRN